MPGFFLFHNSYDTNQQPAPRAPLWSGCWGRGRHSVDHPSVGDDPQTTLNRSRQKPSGTPPSGRRYQYQAPPMSTCIQINCVAKRGMEAQRKTFSRWAGYCGRTRKTQQASTSGITRGRHGQSRLCHVPNGCIPWWWQGESHSRLKTSKQLGFVCILVRGGVLFSELEAEEFTTTALQDQIKNSPSLLSLL